MIVNRQVTRYISKITAITLLIFTGFFMTGCQEKEIVKTGELVSNNIEGVAQTEYVICISKESPNANLYLTEINKIIDSVDCDDLMERYLVRTMWREDFLGELNILDNEGDPINILTSVFSPYQFSGAYGNGVDGVDMYLMVMLADNLEMKPLIRDLPYETAYDYVKNGSADILATGVALSDQVEADFLVSDVYSRGYQQIISDSAENFNKISDLKGKVIGVLSGRPGSELIKETIENGVLKDSGATIIEYGSDAEAYSMYLNEQCDVLIVDEYSAKFMLQ